MKKPWLDGETSQGRKRWCGGRWVDSGTTYA
ncbi:hypothetical protein STAFG_0758 [Streptomyces afghaniensis 772]|uniref:Uncharacterized protein n=1 Tax=Streptomyces afghaniensis 772 TaxID=1283301 RepID=S4NUN4_9ACTN|nr:hypothetical protein STAFG_0758 [Streptomyces afghaniensis 772]